MHLPGCKVAATAQKTKGGKRCGGSGPPRALVSLGTENSQGPRMTFPRPGGVRGNTSWDQPIRPEVFLVVRVLPSKVWL